MKFVFYGKPLTKSNVKICNKNKRFYLPMEYKRYEQGLQYQFVRQRPAGFKMLTGELKVIMSFYFPDNHRRDLINYPKSFCDAFNNLIWEDDSQIVEVYLFKFIDSSAPRVELTVSSKQG